MDFDKQDLYETKYVSDINSTPLIDVLLVLLVVLLICTPLVPKVIDTPVKPMGEHSSAQYPIAIQISESGAILINKQQHNQQQLQDILQQKVANSENVTVLIQPDDQVSYQQLVQVISVIHGSKVSQIQFAQ